MTKLDEMISRVCYEVEYFRDCMLRWARGLYLARRPGWMVLGWDIQGEEADWHAYGGGDRFGMSPTGRFNNRKQAQAFADYRNGEDNKLHGYGCLFYPEHETMIPSETKLESN